MIKLQNEKRVSQAELKAFAESLIKRNEQHIKSGFVMHVEYPNIDALSLQAYLRIIEKVISWDNECEAYEYLMEIEMISEYKNTLGTEEDIVCLEYCGE